MNQKQIILVTGATGEQGGSVAEALLRNGRYTVRILTRNPQAARAVELKNAGAEIVQGDLSDLESLQKAMNGCYGVFGVTNYWEHFEAEYQMGKNLIDAVRQSGIQHFVMSTLPSYYALSSGAFSVPFCDIKAALESYAVSLGLPATFVHVAFYYENFLAPSRLQQSLEDGYYFAFPQGNTKMSMVSVKDVGGVVSTIFNHPVEYTGRVVGIVGEDNTCEEYAAKLTKVLGKQVRYRHISREEYASLGFPGAEESANYYEVQRLYIPNRLIDLIESYGLNPDMQTFEKWLVSNRDKFPLISEATSQRKAA